MFAFTCGHQFLRRQFFDSVIPELRKRLDTLPSPLPLTAQVGRSVTGRRRDGADGPRQMCLSGYHQAHQTHLACPLCLFNGLRQDMQRLQPDAAADKAKNWVL